MCCVCVSLWLCWACVWVCLCLGLRPSLRLCLGLSRSLCLSPLRCLSASVFALLVFWLRVPLVLVSRLSRRLCAVRSPLVIWNLERVCLVAERRTFWALHAFIVCCLRACMGLLFSCPCLCPSGWGLCVFVRVRCGVFVCAYWHVQVHACARACASGLLVRRFRVLGARFCVRAGACDHCHVCAFATHGMCARGLVRPWAGALAREFVLACVRVACVLGWCFCVRAHFGCSVILPALRSLVLNGILMDCIQLSARA